MTQRLLEIFEEGDRQQIITELVEVYQNNTYTSDEFEEALSVTLDYYSVKPEEN